MATKRLPMRKIRDVLRLNASGLSRRQIAASLNLGPTSVGEYLRRARRAALGWPLPESLSDEALEQLLFPPPRTIPRDRRRQPDWASVHRELRKPDVTLSLLWEILCRRTATGAHRVAVVANQPELPDEEPEQRRADRRR